jgi:hypothetical protein
VNATSDASPPYNRLGCDRLSGRVLAFTARHSTLRLCSASEQKEDETDMEYVDALMWLFVIIAIVTVGFFTALYLSTKYAKEADRAWPDIDAVEAEATSAGHH